MKTFTARSMAEAMLLVKRTFGSHSVILHTRSYKRGGVLGIGGKTVVEITAADGRELGKRYRKQAEQSPACAGLGEPPGFASTDSASYRASADTDPRAPKRRRLDSPDLRRRPRRLGARRRDRFSGRCFTSWRVAGRYRDDPSGDYVADTFADSAVSSRARFRGRHRRAAAGGACGPAACGELSCCR